MGSFNTFLFEMLFSRDISKLGNKIKLASMANNRVAETSPPKATVPQKLEIINTENPKNKTIDV